MCDGACDATAAAAQIEHSALHAKAFYRVYCRIDEYLRIHTGDKNVGRDRHRQSIKFPRAGDVCKRLTLKPALYHAVRPFFDLGRCVEIHVAHKLLRCFSGSRGKKYAGLEAESLNAVFSQRISD